MSENKPLSKYNRSSMLKKSGFGRNSSAFKADAIGNFLQNIGDNLRKNVVGGVIGADQAAKLQAKVDEQRITTTEKIQLRKEKNKEIASKNKARLTKDVNNIKTGINNFLAGLGVNTDNVWVDNADKKISTKVNNNNVNKVDLNYAEHWTSPGGDNFIWDRANQTFVEVSDEVWANRIITNDIGVNENDELEFTGDIQDHPDFNKALNNTAHISSATTNAVKGNMYYYTTQDGFYDFKVDMSTWASGKPVIYYRDPLDGRSLTQADDAWEKLPTDDPTYMDTYNELINDPNNLFTEDNSFTKYLNEYIKATSTSTKSTKTYKSGEKILPEWKRLGYRSDKEYKASDYYKYNVLNK